jgi:vanillate O-demethylase monooxygenase subunit
VREGGDRTGGFQIKMLNCVTPETERTTHYFYSTANGYSQDDPLATRALFDEVTKTFLEDKEICEAQQVNIDEMPEPPLIVIKSDRARTIYSRQLAKRLAEQGTTTGNRS